MSRPPLAVIVSLPPFADCADVAARRALRAGGSPMMICGATADRDAVAFGASITAGARASISGGIAATTIEAEGGATAAPDATAGAGASIWPDAAPTSTRTPVLTSGAGS